MSQIRVLLIEDNRLLREGIASMLNEHVDIKVVTTTGNGDVLEKARDLRPQVVLLDLGLKNQDSLKVVQSLKKEFPETEIVVMDLIPVEADVVEYVKVGVSGFILKDATISDFVDTIRSVAQGAKVLPPPLAGSLFSQIVEHAVQTGKMNRLIESVRMTQRELEIVELIAQGRSNKDIAAGLSIAIHTVKSHVHNILEKLALHTRLELARFALTGGLAKRDPEPAP
jgi:DNA-binding NarL/FixJ family response regulator